MFEIAIIGGGMVGSAIAYGCAIRGARTLLIDEGDAAPRAARANAGLVWSQGKGDGMPAYAAWTRQSLALWPEFAETIGRLGGRAVAYRRSGGISFCVGPQELEARANLVRRMHNQSGGPATAMRMIDRGEIAALLPGVALGRDVLGGSFTPEDGHVNPLLLLRGFHVGLRRSGGAHWAGRRVAAIEPCRDGFVLDLGGEKVAAEKVVVACGLGIPKLAAMVGMNVPVHPVRGQMIVTERVAPMLNLPCSGVRQTGEGTLQIGTTYEEGESDPVTRVGDLSRMAARAMAVLPALRDVPVVRSWAGIRPMPPDGCPIYAQSAAFPGAFAAVCHSGVTLAAAHAGPVAQGVIDGILPEGAAGLGPERFAA